MRTSHAAACVMLFVQMLYFFDVVEIVIEPSSTLNRIILFTGFMVASALALTKLPITLRVLRVAWPVALLIVWFWLTSFWSDMPGMVRQRSITYAIAYISALGLAVGMRSPRGFVTTLFFVACVVISANILSLAVPSVSQSPIGIKGIHLHKNVAGFVAIMCGTIIAFAMTQSRSHSMRILSILMVTLAFAFLLATQSKTNFFVLAVLIAMTPVYLLMVHGREAKLAHVVLTCIVCAVIFLLGTSTSALTGLGALYGDPTLTNRSVIWSEVGAFIARSPWLGIGFGSFWDIGGETNLFTTEYYEFYNDPNVVNQSHNGYIDIMLHGGRIGLFLAYAATAYVLCFTLLLATSRIVPRRSKWIFCMLQCLIIMVMVQNLTESTMYFPSSSTSYFILILLAQGVRWKVDLDASKVRTGKVRTGKVRIGRARASRSTRQASAARANRHPADGN